MGYNLEHIGIAVKNLELSIPLFEKLLNSPCYKTESVGSESVNTAFFLQQGTKIELLESTDPEGVIAKFIARKGEGMHHIAFEVDDIEQEISRLSQLGFELIHQSPKDGADNKRIAFLHPKSTEKLLVELCQEK